MTTAGVLGLMLAFEPKEPGIMTRPPRDPKSSILSKESLFRIVLVGFALLLTTFGLFEWEESRGASHAQARTVAVNAFAVISALYVLNCRSLSGSSFKTSPFKNVGIPLGILIMMGIQVAFTHTNLMNNFFHSAPIGIESWARIVAAGVLVFVIVEIKKWWFRRKTGGSNQVSGHASVRGNGQMGTEAHGRPGK
jgi:Ca2+-transporting ATPase